MVVGVRAPWTEEATFISPDLRPGGLISWLFRPIRPDNQRFLLARSPEAGKADVLHRAAIRVKTRTAATRIAYLVQTDGECVSCRWSYGSMRCYAILYPEGRHPRSLLPCQQTAGPCKQTPPTA
ncbi:hypothetical protein IG631_23080 [Alternaria alternata]|nr:hypothetical protein IG631_23080 [Alternaria alternata]